MFQVTFDGSYCRIGWPSCLTDLSSRFRFSSSSNLPHFPSESSSMMPVYCSIVVIPKIKNARGYSPLFLFLHHDMPSFDMTNHCFMILPRVFLICSKHDLALLFNSFVSIKAMIIAIAIFTLTQSSCACLFPAFPFMITNPRLWFEHTYTLPLATEDQLHNHSSIYADGVTC